MSKGLLAGCGRAVARSVKEWIGKTDDAPFPPRVRLRILDRFAGNCASCGKHIVGRFTCDHIVALINGGENRESNGQPLCRDCTKLKDKADVSVKSKTAAVRKARHGLKGKARGFWRPPGAAYNWRKRRYER
jgi:5-methylcytosine-specific restriction protein A